MKTITPPMCPNCDIPLELKQTAKIRNRDGSWSKFWGCPNWPDCNATTGCHPDGTPFSVVVTPVIKKWRFRCHRVAELIWGLWDEIGKHEKAKMYSWIKNNTPKAHISHMELDELKECYEAMISYGEDQGIDVSEETVQAFLDEEIANMEAKGWNVQHLK